MKIRLCLLLAAALLTGISTAQNAAMPAGQAPATGPATASPQATPASPAQAQAPAGTPTVPVVMQFTPGTLIRVKLDKTVDAKKAQVGEQVVAKTLDDLKSVPPGLATKGCDVIGHVVEVKEHQGDSVSKLDIVFDKMVLKNGTSMPLPAFIKAVGFADQFNPATNIEAINRMGGTPGGQGTSEPGSVTAGGSAPSQIGAGGGNPSMYGGGRMPTSGASNPDAKLPYNAVGPVGMSGVELSQGTAQDSILTSKKKNVKLEGGMQMILKTQ
jgi:hypothetical protein